MTATKGSDVYVDFQNADNDGFVRLNTCGSICDLGRLGIVLRDGLDLTVSDGEISVPGTVRSPGSEGLGRVQVDWAGVFSAHAQRP